MCIACNCTAVVNMTRPGCCNHSENVPLSLSLTIHILLLYCWSSGLARVHRHVHPVHYRIQMNCASHPDGSMVTVSKIINLSFGGLALQLWLESYRLLRQPLRGADLTTTAIAGIVSFAPPAITRSRSEAGVILE